MQTREGQPMPAPTVPDAQQTARNFTLKGIEGLIRHNRRCLAELAELECSFAGGGSQEAAESRAARVLLIRAKLASNLEALNIRQARIDAGEVSR